MIAARQPATQQFKTLEQPGRAIEQRTRLQIFFTQAAHFFIEMVMAIGAVVEIQSPWTILFDYDSKATLSVAFVQRHLMLNPLP